METPTLRREGDDFIYLWSDTHISIALTQLRETSEGLVGEIAVETMPWGASPAGHLHRARFNLSSTQARVVLQKALHARADRVAWQDLIEYVCRATTDLWRAGEPVVDLAAMAPAGPLEYLVARLLPKGETTVVYGDGGSGKSLLAMALGVALRTGHSLPAGLRPHGEASVLYLDWETQAATQRRRLESLCRGFGIANIPSVYYRAMYRSIADDIASIRREVARRSIGLVIIDSLGPACGGEPESAELMIRVLNALRTLSPATRLVVSHLSKAAAEQAGGAAKAFGSTFVHNMARSAWEVRCASNGHDVLSLGLFHRKANDDRPFEPLGLRVSFEDGVLGTGCITFESFEVEGEPELAAHASLAWRVRRALRQGVMVLEELAQELEVGEKTLRRALRRMPDVLNLGEERWALKERLL